MFFTKKDHELIRRLKTDLGHYKKTDKEDGTFYVLNNILDSDLFRSKFDRVEADKYFNEIKRISKKVINAIKKGEIPNLTYNRDKK